ncbi:hypothetical protein [Croceicoccus marinus]|nr:hypothetical protein [Croceicoccus marinus]
MRHRAASRKSGDTLAKSGDKQAAVIARGSQWALHPARLKESG